jgi:heme exporter protein D
MKSRAETDGLIKSIGSNQVARHSILQVVTQKKRREALMQKVSVDNLQ